MTFNLEYLFHLSQQRRHQSYNHTELKKLQGVSFSPHTKKHTENKIQFQRVCAAVIDQQTSMKIFSDFCLYASVLGILICKNNFAQSPHRIAVLLVDTSGTETTETRNLMHTAFFGSPPQSYSIASFYQEVSYGKMMLQGEVFGWKQLKDIDPCSLKNGELLDLFQDEINFKQFESYAFLIHPNDKNCEQLGLGFSSFGAENENTSQGQIEASFTRMNVAHRLVRPKLPFQKLSGITSSVIAHELGHSFGIRSHANILDCGKETLSRDSTQCQQIAIADMFNIMAGEGFFRSSLHMSACHKEDLGWLQPSQIQTIIPTPHPNTYTLAPLETPSATLPIALKIPLQIPIPVNDKVLITALYLENRSPIGFDRRLNDLQNYPENLYEKITTFSHWYPNKKTFSVDPTGIQIRGAFFNEGHCATTYLLDTKPNSLGYAGEEYSLYDSLDSTLNIGDNFYEPYNQISISALQRHQDAFVEIAVKYQ